MSKKDQNPILIDLPMPIETDRLILRPVMPGDGAAMHEAKKETWDAINRWMPWAKEIGTPEEDEALSREKYAKFILREDIMIVGIEKESGRPVVWTGLHRFDWQTRQFEIGYWVRQSAQGNGYATESTNALIRYAFNVLAARRVKIDHAGGNEASRRVIEKLGFVPEGIMKAALELPDGTMADRHYYARLTLDGLPPLKVKWGPP